MKNQRTLFVTGVDTEVGKTIGSSVLVEALQADYWKPIQSGDLDQSDTMKIEKLAKHAGKIHPEGYRLNHPLSPHASAELDGITIELGQLKPPKTDNHLIIEGAGGLMVPLNNKDLIANLITPDMYVILVTKHYLGSINHTLLSYQSLKNKGINKIAIWVNGEPNSATEAVYKQHTQAFLLERLSEMEALTPENITQQAQRISESLSAFLALE